MKNIIYTTFILLLLILASCTSDKSTAYPEDLQGKQALLSEKKTQLKDLQKEIDILKTEIEVLAPNRSKVVKVVAIDTLSKSAFTKFVNIQGVVKSGNQVNVSAATGGRIVRLYVEEGQYIKRGKLIAKLDIETLDNQVSELQTSLSLAKQVYERQARLWSQNIGSELQYLEAKTNKERLEKSLATINSQVSKGNVYAPISGVVDKEYMSSGEMASPGLPIVSIISTSSVKVEADLPESYLGIIKKGDLVDINFPALDRSLKSRVSLIGRTIDPANRTFKVEVELKNPGPSLKPNLLAEMKIKELSQSDIIKIPLTLVQEEISGQRYVYVMVEENNSFIAKKKYIDIGESFDEEVVIPIGLKENDLLITEGSRNIVANEPVQLIKPTTK